MRTTVDLPDELHRRAIAIARDTGTTLSQTIAALMRKSLEGGERRTWIDPVTGLQVASMGHVVTSEDVRAMEDDVP